MSILPPHHNVRLMKTLLTLFTTLTLVSHCLVAQESAPSFTVSDLEGNRYALEELNDKVVVLNFWFIQCRPCVMEMPELNELVAKYADEDVVFLAFATNEPAALEAFLQKKDFDYHIIPSSQDVAEAYAVEGYPTHVVINPAGEVAYRTMGLSPHTVGDLEKEIKKLL